MGGGGSTSRNITMEEDPDTGMVKVSEDVLRRMLGQEEQPMDYGEQDDKLSQHQLKQVEDKWQSRLSAVEKKWQERLRAVEDRNANTFELNAEEFKKAAEEVEAKFIRQSHVPICQNLQDEVLKCFTENPKQTLKCSQQVKDFTLCVEQARTSIVTKKSLAS